MSIHIGRPTLIHWDILPAVVQFQKGDLTVIEMAQFWSGQIFELHWDVSASEGASHHPHVLFHFQWTLYLQTS